MPWNLRRASVIRNYFLTNVPTLGCNMTATISFTSTYWCFWKCYHLFSLNTYKEITHSYSLMSLKWELHNWSFVWKTLLNQSPKPHDCKIKSADFDEFHSWKPWILIKNCRFWSETAVFSQKLQILSFWTQLTAFKTIWTDFCIVYPIHCFQDHLTQFYSCVPNWLLSRPYDLIFLYCLPSWLLSRPFDLFLSLCTLLTPFKTIWPNFIIVYLIDSFQDHLT